MKIDRFLLQSLRADKRFGALYSVFETTRQSLEFLEPGLTLTNLLVQRITVLIKQTSFLLHVRHETIIRPFGHSFNGATRNLEKIIDRQMLKDHVS